MHEMKEEALETALKLVEKKHKRVLAILIESDLLLAIVKKEDSPTNIRFIIFAVSLTLIYHRIRQMPFLHPAINTSQRTDINVALPA